MRTPAKLAAFGGALAVVFGGALGIGDAFGTPLPGPPARHDSTHADSPARDAGADAGGGAAAALPGGLMVSDRGYTLDLVQDTLPAGTGSTLAYRILGADGQPVTSYTPAHDKDMHLIAVRRDTTGFQHVHPTLSADGTWTTSLDLTAGTWRVFADFVPAQGGAAGENLTLGTDLAVAGDYRPAPLPAPSTTTQVEDYTVTLAGRLVAGQESQLVLSVSRNGQPVTDLQPYLAAYGHLVALRAGDLAYLHVHPAGQPGDGTTAPGPDITFAATTPSTGDYRLFLDFRHGDVVRTAEFTVQATGGPAPAPAAAAHGSDGHGH
jgi:hypothetical protein